MSFEENINDLTQAINALTAAVLGASQQVAKPKEEAKKPASAKVEKPAATQPTAPADAAPEVKATSSAPVQASVVDFAMQIQKPIVNLAATGKRAEALAILKELGVPRASDIKPEDYPRAVELIAKAA